ncbi:hypothetical protein P6166_07310 [Stenotrophomonas sp. HITSZ_GD]|uniref:hypothetical protein n=1 Tax=Stenotrophomonas sp. HITSZ_GD TaxID=3037248 RepID=UPI00240E730C|nr:hypothetical protein [Stenotrophomonas sp. HITSZ_GD]MDG2525159.1 hypothetical protein [Stenotrophomonas sp. HITSZ_GD]
MAATERTSWDETFAHRAGAALFTVLVLLMMFRVLLHAPTPSSRTQADALQVTFIPREQAAPPPRVVPPAEASPPERRVAPAAVPARAPSPATATPPPVTPPQPAGERMAATLYSRSGSARLPDAAAVDPFAEPDGSPPGTENARELARAKKVLERPNPIDYKPTAFDKDWTTDGTLGDVAMQGIGRGMKKLNKAIFGPDIQPAKARPPPDVRFNPALHERQQDLGSEATGDAYKAAPIAFEKAPGHDGEASRRIRQALAELQSQAAACAPERMQPLLATVRKHLGELEQVERAFAKGADPVMAEQLLPRQADSAYDLARRALWYAREKTADCRR